MLIKRTHHFLQWAFWLFVAYLLITRLFISWVQFYPQQFIGLAQSVTQTEIKLAHIEVEQSWLGFQTKIDKLSIDSPDFQFQADFLAVDINLLALFIPAVEYGDYLEISQGAFQNKVQQPAGIPSQEEFQPEDLANINVNISRFWKRVTLKNLVLTEVGRPGLSVQFYDFQSLNASRLTIVGEFSLNYKDVLNYERFHLKSSFSPDVWGDLGTGEFSLSSFRPLRIKRLSKLLSQNWQAVLPQGELILDLKGSISQSQIASLEVNLHTQALHWTQKQEGLPVSLGLQLLWNAEQQNIQKHFKDWKFSLAKIEIDNQFIKTVSPVELYFEQGKYLNFNADYFDIEPFKVLVKSLIHTQHVAALFDRAAYLSISKLNGKLDWQTLDVPELAVHFDRLDVPVTDYPGMSLQHLQIVKTPSHILVSTPKPIWVMSPTIHSKPMKLSLPNSVELKFDEVDQAWQLTKTQINLDKIPVSITLKKLTSSTIDSEFDLKVSSIAELKDYLPYGLMSPKLKSWLSESLQGGEDVSLNGVVKGAFADFPFEEGQGEFMVTGQVKNARLKFDSKWPVLKDFDANLVFKPFQLAIDVDKVNIGADVLATNVNVTIPDLHQHDIALTVKGNVVTSLNNAANYLSLSPIASKLGMQAFFKESGKFSGNSSVVLDQIWVPISGYEGRNEEVSGRVIFQNASLQLFKELSLSRINGTLQFTDSVISADKLTFDALDGKGVAKIVTDSKNKQVKVQAGGNLFAQKHDWFQKPIPWDVNLTIPFKSAKKSDISLALLADVSQGDSLLPAPFDAKALHNKKVELYTKISKSNILVDAKLPGLVNSQFHWQELKDAYQLQSNKIAIGVPDKIFKRYSKSTSFIRGEFDFFDIDAWIPIFKKADLFEKKADTERSLILDDVSFAIENTRFLSHNYKQIVIDVNSSVDKPVSVDIKSKDIAGSVLFENDNLIRVDLSRFKFFTDDTDIKNGTDSSAFEQAGECQPKADDNSVLPNVVLTGQNISIDERKIDAISFRLEDGIEQLSIKDIKGNFGGKAGVLNASYEFSKKKQQSLFKAQLTSNDVSAVTEFIKLNKGFSGKSADVNLQLNWFGGLECFSTKAASGDIRFKIKEGSVEDVEPGFARLIGLLSVESLVRRLQLDLKDVTNKGMVYDEIKGSAILKNGLLNLTEFTIKAPSANGDISGMVNIEKQTFDLNAKITPKIGATIPTLAALAGAANPLTALAVYTLMKVIPGVNENLITYKYKISGPWASPIIDGEKLDESKESKASGNSSILDIN
ncbi:DUF3971 domain-containing protein [Thiomicrorhabdus immobilis]|uniref:DUF3971 domain-containing protein n=1 Tax=Thiomicrorhabdus immobilis TaxID=2791037 RepID=A0ABN6CXS5_9GAMM|nr:AsmA-like C-terminal region-containing protein [Thiomicrorhabdus immobilis]BCN93937.1 DUF3971 domain-containing protein [Thiomicrorhabdus immobilis]